MHSVTGGDIEIQGMFGICEYGFFAQHENHSPLLQCYRSYSICSYFVCRTRLAAGEFSKRLCNMIEIYMPPDRTGRLDATKAKA
jgi:hypothetical protein